MYFQLMVVAMLAALGPTARAQVSPLAPRAEIRAFFTTPEGSAIQSPTATEPVDALARYISGAKIQIDFCMFRLNHVEVVEALIGAHDRGVKVRVLTDEDYWSSSYAESYQALINAGIEVRVDVSPIVAVMHNKFVVFDDQAIWTGDWNAHTNDSKVFHTALYIPLVALARQYSIAFDQLWTGDVPDTLGKAIRTEPVVYRQGSETCTIQPYFSPAQSGDELLKYAIADAQSSIKIAHGIFFSRAVYTELIRAAERGVHVEFLHQLVSPGILGSLTLSGVDVRKGSKYVGCKFLLIDGNRLITGSYNADIAETGIENILDVTADALLYEDFESYFDSAMALASPFAAAHQRTTVTPAPPERSYASPIKLAERDPKAPIVLGIRVDPSDPGAVVSVRVSTEGCSGDSASYLLAVYIAKKIEKDGASLDPACLPVTVYPSADDLSAGGDIEARFELAEKPANWLNVSIRVLRLDLATGSRRVVGSYAINVADAIGQQ